MTEHTDPLAELSEAIEKARGKGLIRGGSSKAFLRTSMKADLSTGSRKRRLQRAATYLFDRQLGTRRKKGAGGMVTRHHHTRTGVYKSLEALDEVIEKAGGKGLIRGGSKRLQRKMQGRAYGAASWGDGRWGSNRASRAHRANRYLSTRTGRDTGGATPGRSYRGQGGLSPRSRISRDRKGVYKSDIAKAKPKTLYVYRPVENAADIIAWAESQGFKSTQPADKIHVTLAYSKTPLNWAMLHDDYHLEPSDYAQSCGCEVVSRSDDNSKRRKISGGVREVKALGDDGAVVLAFESDSLTHRWMDFKRAGAVWKFPSFTPHITISYDGGSVDLSKVHPYAGDIILGEECWEEVSENGQAEAIAAETKGVKKALADLTARVEAVEKTKEAA